MKKQIVRKGAHVPLKYQPSIKKKLLLMIFTPVLVVGVVSLFLIYQVLKSSSYQIAAKSSDLESIKAAKMVDRYLKKSLAPVRKTATMLSNYELLTKTNQKEFMMEQLQALAKSGTSIKTIWLYLPLDDSDQPYQIKMKRSSQNEWQSDQFSQKEIEQTRKAIDEKAHYVSDPYYRKGSMHFIYSLPISDHNGKIMGAFAVEIDLLELQKYIAEIKVFSTGFVRLLSYSGIVIAHPNANRVGKFSGELDPKGQGSYLEYIQNGILHNSIEYSKALKKNTFKSIAPVQIGATYWSVGTVITQQEIMAKTDRTLRIVMIIGLVFIILIGSIILFISFDLANPIVQVAEIANYISKLDVTYDVPKKLLIREDEIGILAHAFQNTIQSIRDSLKNTLEQSQKIDSYSERLSTISLQSSEATRQISLAMDEIVKGIEVESNNIETIVNHLEEFGDRLDEDQAKIAHIKEMTDRVAVQKNEGIANIEDLVSKNDITKESSNKINKAILETNQSVAMVAKLSLMIRKIASQTNLLALNAAIEAEHAGETGRGFSIVAEEVGKLAAQSENFSNKITANIKDLKIQTENITDIMDEVMEAIHKQDDSVEKTKGNFDQIADSIAAKKKLIEQLNTSGQQMKNKKDEIIQSTKSLSNISHENAAATEQISASLHSQAGNSDKITQTSQSLEKLSDKMHQLLSQFKY